METMFTLRCGMPLWLLSGCLTVWALRAKACDELKLRKFWSSRVSEFCVIAEYVAKRGHLPSSCGPNTGI